MAAGTVVPGPHWQRYVIPDNDQAHDFIRRIFLDVRVLFSGAGPAGSGIRAIATGLGDVAAVRMRYFPRTQLQTVPDGDLNITQVLSGRCTLSRGKDEYRVRSGDAMLVLPDHGMDVDNEDLGAFTVRLPRALVEGVAHAQSGVTGAALRFDGTQPMSVSLGRQWAETVTYLTRGVLADPALMANPLVAGQARQLLAATALAVFPNTSHDARGRRPAGEVIPRTVRRAMAYIDDNAARPLTVVEIAAAAGINVRALRYAFRLHRNMTPLQYARAVRLERAHRDLQAGDPDSGATVAGIANRWGFVHLGRFGTDYRAAYGVSPGQTLRS